MAALKKITESEIQRLYSQFNSLSSFLKEERRPDNTVLYEATSVIIQKFHFLLLEPLAPIVTLEQYQQMFFQFCNYNLPCLFMTVIKHMGPEDREKYTLIMLNSIMLSRKYKLYRQYCRQRAYIDLLLIGHGWPQAAQYCARILEKLLEEVEVMKIILKNQLLLNLTTFANCSRHFLIQGQALKTLKICFESAIAAGVEIENETLFKMKFVQMSASDNFYLRVMSIQLLALLMSNTNKICIEKKAAEVLRESDISFLSKEMSKLRKAATDSSLSQSLQLLAVILCSSQKLYNRFAKEEAMFKDLINILTSRKTQKHTKKAILMLMSVFLGPEDSIPPVILDNIDKLKREFSKLKRRNIFVPVFHKLE